MHELVETMEEAKSDATAAMVVSGGSFNTVMYRLGTVSLSVPDDEDEELKVTFEYTVLDSGETGLSTEELEDSPELADEIGKNLVELLEELSGQDG